MSRGQHPLNTPVTVYGAVQAAMESHFVFLNDLKTNTQTYFGPWVRRGQDQGGGEKILSLYQVRSLIAW